MVGDFHFDDHHDYNYFLTALEDAFYWCTDGISIQTFEEREEEIRKEEEYLYPNKYNLLGEGSNIYRLTCVNEINYGYFIGINCPDAGWKNLSEATLITE